MPNLALQFKCEAKGLTDVRYDYEAAFVVKTLCGQCGEVNDNVHVTRAEEVDVPGGRGTANLVVKCKFCARQGNISILPSPAGEQNPAWTPDADGWVTMAVFDCRNVGVDSWVLGEGWTARGAESGTKFAEIDLGEGEFFDYDEKAEEAVELTECVTRVEKQ